MVDASGTYVFVNQAFCRISGYEEHDLLQIKFAATLHPDDRAYRLKKFGQLLRGEIGSYISERRFIRKDGKLAWVRLSVTVPSEQARPAR